MSRLSLVVGVWGSLGCSEPERFPYVEITDKASVVAVRTLPPPTVPACGASVLDGRVRVRATQTPIEARSAKKISVFPFDQESILVGVRANRASPDTAGTGKLWRVPCGAPDKATVVFEQEQADFGYAVLGAHRRQLIYTGHDGIYAIRIRDDAGEPGPHPPATRITRVPKPGVGCWLHGDPGAQARSRDVVKRLSDYGGALVFERWSPCGYGGVWVGRELHLSKVGLPDEPALAPRPVSAVAVDTKDRVWLADAGRCSEPGVLDLQTRGAVYVSRDKAESWKRVRVVADGAPMPTAARSVLTDAKRHGSAIVLSALCDYQAGKVGGLLYFTRSVGAKWAQVSIPKHVGVVVDGGFGVTAVELVDGSIDRLVVWGADGRAFRTRNGGASWRPADDAGVAPSGARTATVGSFKLRVTREGLQRVAVDGSATFVFPTPETRIEDDVDTPQARAGAAAGASAPDKYKGGADAKAKPKGAK